MKTHRTITTRTRLLINELLALALNTPHEVADIFINWSPHCDNLSVSVNLGGWKSSYEATDDDLRETVYLQSGRDGMAVAKILRRVRKLVANAPQTLAARKELERTKKRQIAERLLAEIATP